MNVHQRISQLFAQHGPVYRDHWERTSPVDPQQDTLTQVIAVNHYFRVQLNLLSADTQTARMCLVIERYHSQWLLNMEEYVIPVAVRYGLPIWQAS